MSTAGHTRARRRVCWSALALAAMLATAGCGDGSSSDAGKPANPQLILATTTSTQDSGLLDELVPAFEKDSGYEVKTVAVGTGQALKMGREGNADVLLVHAPKSEEEFVSAGHGVDRRVVAHNYFLIAGPESDPAGVAKAASAADAFKKIAAAGSSFVSRGDGSGTETKELAIWKDAGITPKRNSWYVQSGQGMGATLQIASEKGAYTITDDATFVSIGSRLKLTNLFKDDPTLLNIYHVISVNQARWPKANIAGATAFADYITSADGQKIIGEFGKAKYGQALFVPDAGKAAADIR